MLERALCFPHVSIQLTHVHHMANLTARSSVPLSHVWAWEHSNVELFHVQAWRVLPIPDFRTIRCILSSFKVRLISKLKHKINNKQRTWLRLQTCLITTQFLNRENGVTTSPLLSAYPFGHRHRMVSSSFLFSSLLFLSSILFSPSQQKP